MKRRILALAAALPLCAAPAAAQYAAPYLEGGVGFMVVDVLDADVRASGWLVGARGGWTRSRGLGVFVEAGYGNVDDLGQIGVSTDAVLYGWQVQTYTVGVSYQLGALGPLTPSLEFGLGAILGRNDVEGVRGNPHDSFYPGGGPDRVDDWTASAVAAPALSFAAAIHRRAEVVLRVRDLIILDDARGAHNLGVTVGVRVGL